MHIICVQSFRQTRLHAGTLSTCGQAGGRQREPQIWCAAAAGDGRGRLQGCCPQQQLAPLVALARAFLSSCCLFDHVQRRACLYRML
jgi:hypothetical protein